MHGCADDYMDDLGLQHTYFWYAYDWSRYVLCRQSKEHEGRFVSWTDIHADAIESANQWPVGWQLLLFKLYIKFSIIKWELIIGLTTLL